MMFSCSDVKTDVKKLEGKWNIVEVKGEKILKEGLPNMEFDMKDNNFENKNLKFIWEIKSPMDLTEYR